MDARPAKSHAFVPPPTNEIIPTPTEVAKKLLDTVFSKVASTTLSHVLESIGLDEPVDAESIALLLQVQQQLDVLQKSVDAVSQQLVQVSYDQWAALIVNIKIDVQEAFKGLKYAAQTPKDKAFAKDVYVKIDKLYTDNALTKLHAYLIGQDSTTGGYRSWSNLIKSKNTVFWTPAQSKQLQEYFAFYDTIQAQLIWLLSERATKVGWQPKTFQDNDGATFATQQAAQAAVRNTIRVAPMAIDLRTNIMWPPDALHPAVKAGVAPSQLTDRLNLQNANRWAGFSDWRVPTTAELQGLVAGHPQPRGWFTQQWGPEAFPIYPYPTYSTVSVWSNQSSSTSNCSGKGNRQTVVLNLQTGGTQWLCDGDATGLLPVRTVTPAEKYWL